MWELWHSWMVESWGYCGYGPFHMAIWMILAIAIVAVAVWRVAVAAGVVWRRAVRAQQQK